MQCPSCSRPVAADAIRCLYCESDLGEATRTVAMESPRWIAELPTFAPGKVFAGRFTIVEQVARSGMSVVYKAIDRELGGEVALKLLPPELAARADYVERFRREVRVTRQINHPNVCRVYDLGSYEGILYFFMEWVKGETLRDLLLHSRKVEESRALEIAEKVAHALQAAHDHGVIHRDLKPGNVMIDDRGEVRVMDFGVASEAGPSDWTSLYQVPGTPEYMAPEQRRGRPVDARTDLYALGLMLQEMLTGDPAAPAHGAASAVVNKLRAEDPAARYASATAAATALAEIRPRLRPSAPPLARRFEARRVRNLSLVLGGALAAVGAFLIFKPARAPVSPSLVYYQRGEHYLREEAETVPRIDDAIHMFYRSTRADSLFARGWAGLGEAYWMRYERTKEKTSRDEAERAVERAMRLDGDLPVARLAKARGLIATGKAEEGRDLLLALTKDEPKLDPAWASLGRAYQVLGKYDLGLAALREAIRLKPQSFRYHIQLGVFHQRNEEYAAAEKEFLRAIELKRDSPTAWSNLAASYLFQNKPEKAVPALVNALKYEPRAATYSNLGTAYYYLKRYEDAAESYRHASEMDPADPTYPGNLGDAYRMLGREAAADSAYHEALRRARAILAGAPDDKAVRNQLALWYARLHDARGALAEAQRVLRRDPDDVDALFTNAVIRAVLGQDDAALDWLERAVRLGLGKAAILNDPDLARLRGQPRFERVLELAS